MHATRLSLLRVRVQQTECVVQLHGEWRDTWDGVRLRGYETMRVGWKVEGCERQTLRG